MPRAGGQGRHRAEPRCEVGLTRDAWRQRPRGGADPVGRAVAGRDAAPAARAGSAPGRLDPLGLRSARPRLQPPRARLGIGRDIAVALAARGIASLRYDRRGVGGSSGSFLAAGFHENTTDAGSALAFLRDRPDVARCFAVGHSEGALHAAAVAGDGAHDDLAGVVLLAPAAKTGEETLAWQAAQIAPTLPAPVRLLLRLLRTDLTAKQAKNVRRLQSTTGDIERIDGRRMNARWHREFIAFDPKPSLARIRVPVLAVAGDKDLQVDPEDLALVASTVGGPVDTVRVPDLTHVLRRDPGSPSLSAYRRLIRQPTDAETLDAVGEWVQARAR